MAMIKIKTNKEIGYKISDIGVGGKEYNIETYGYYPKPLSRKKIDKRKAKFNEYGINIGKYL